MAKSRKIYLGLAAVTVQVGYFGICSRQLDRLELTSSGLVQSAQDDSYLVSFPTGFVVTVLSPNVSPLLPPPPSSRTKNGVGICIYILYTNICRYVCTVYRYVYIYTGTVLCRYGTFNHKVHPRGRSPNSSVLLQFILDYKNIQNYE
jgi:hypothetical protein